MAQELGWSFWVRIAATRNETGISETKNFLLSQCTHKYLYDNHIMPFIGQGFCLLNSVLIFGPLNTHSKASTQINASALIGLITYEVEITKQTNKQSKTAWKKIFILQNNKAFFPYNSFILGTISLGSVSFFGGSFASPNLILCLIYRILLNVQYFSNSQMFSFNTGLTGWKCFFLM